LPFETAMATIDVEETRGFGASEDVEEIISTDEAVEAAEEAPMSFEPRHEERKGFFSLFGRSRQDDVPPLRDYRNDPTPAIQARIALGGTAPAPAPQMEQQEEGEDLEIPSFLRRLAN
ncbi:MAG: hypothetical protein WCG92_25240, partial [Hyphomicrobiales bacterium]